MNYLALSKRSLYIFILSLGCTLINAGPQIHVNDNDDFFDIPSHLREIEESFAQMRKQMKGMRNSFGAMGFTEEENKSFADAQKRLSKIKPSISNDDSKISISFNLDGINKNDIKIVKESQGFIGTIPTKDGIVEFILTPHQLRIARSVHIKKEESPKTDQPDDAKAPEQKKQSPQATFMYSSYSSEVQVQGLPFVIDLATAQAETKDNKIILTVSKKKESLLPISHK